MVPILEDPATQSSPNCERGMIVCQQENICKDLCSEHSTAHKPVLFGAELIGRTVRLMLKQGRQQGGSLRWGNKRVVVGFAAGLHVLKEDMKDGKPEQVYLGPGLRFKIEQGEDDDLPANPSHDPSLDSQLSVGRKLSVFWTGMGRWYRGEVVAYNEEEGAHTVVYADGETHEHVLRHESVKWVPSKGASQEEQCVEGDLKKNSSSALALPKAVLLPAANDSQPSCNTSTAVALQPATPVQLIESAKARPFHKTSQAAATSSEPSQQSNEGHRSAVTAAPHSIGAATVNRGMRPPLGALKVCLPPVSIKGEDASQSLGMVMGLAGTPRASAPSSAATQDGLSGMRSYSSSPAPTTDLQQQGPIAVARRTTKGALAMRAVTSTSCPAGFSMADPGHSTQGLQLGGRAIPAQVNMPATPQAQQQASLLVGASIGSLKPVTTIGPACQPQQQHASMQQGQVAPPGPPLQCTNIPPSAPASLVLAPSSVAAAGASSVAVQPQQAGAGSQNTLPASLPSPAAALPVPACAEPHQQAGAGGTCGQKRVATEPPLWDEEVEAREDVAPQHKAWNAAGAAVAAAARAVEANKRARKSSVPYSPVVGHAFVAAAPTQVASGPERQLYQLRCRLQMLKAITARIAAAEIAEAATKG